MNRENIRHFVLYFVLSLFILVGVVVCLSSCSSPDAVEAKTSNFEFDITELTTPYTTDHFRVYSMIDTEYNQEYIILVGERYGEIDTTVIKREKGKEESK